MQEYDHAETAEWVTLTYDTKHVPLTDRGFASLRKSDVQLFFKRLRKAENASGSNLPPIKYYTAGEYGGKGMRPHYHAIIFNCTVGLVSPAWKMGHVHYGTVTRASVGYTLKYMSKPRQIPKHRNDDRIPEFSLMSKRLGAKYMTDEMIKWHHADLENRMYINIEDGKKIAMPRYFKQKIYTDEQREQAGHATLQRMRKQQEQNALIITTHDYQAGVAAAYEKMHADALRDRHKI